MQNEAYPELGVRKANSVVDNRLVTVKVKPRSDQACSLFSIFFVLRKEKPIPLFSFALHQLDHVRREVVSTWQLAVP